MSTVDFRAIADAIAVRFGPTVVTPPSGELAITQATASLPATVSDERVTLVFPATSADFEYPPSARKGSAIFPVRFYLYKPTKDTPRNSELLNDWLTAMLESLDGKVQLGLSTYVTGAQVVHAETGRLTYAGIEFNGIEFTVEVNFGYGVNFSA